MLVAAFVTGFFLVAPLQQALAAVIATDVQCNGCVGTPDLASNAVTYQKDGALSCASSVSLI